MNIRDFFTSLRIRHWTKNVLVFAALIFAHEAAHPIEVIRTLAGFILFCFAAGAVYIHNDIVDIDQDRMHPTKGLRPIASGRVTIRTGWITMVAVLAVDLPLSFILSPQFGTAVIAYVLLQILYSRRFRNVVILDVFIISMGFVLRVVAGAVIIGVAVSSWILVCTMLLALFLALSKRRHELTLLEEGACAHRPILCEYSAHLLDQMIGVVTSATLVAYMIYSLSDETVAKFGPNMILTVPFVLYGIFRYLYLIHQKNAGGQPEEIILSDLPMQLAIIGYGIVSIAVIYF